MAATSSTTNRERAGLSPERRRSPIPFRTGGATPPDPQHGEHDEGVHAGVRRRVRLKERRAARGGSEFRCGFGITSGTLRGRACFYLHVAGETVPLTRALLAALGGEPVRLYDRFPAWLRAGRVGDAPDALVEELRLTVLVGDTPDAADDYVDANRLIAPADLVGRRLTCLLRARPASWPL